VQNFNSFISLLMLQLKQLSKRPNLISFHIVQRRQNQTCVECCDKSTAAAAARSISQCQRLYNIIFLDNSVSSIQNHKQLMSDNKVTTKVVGKSFSYKIQCKLFAQSTAMVRDKSFKFATNCGDTMMPNQFSSKSFITFKVFMISFGILGIQQRISLLFTSSSARDK